MIPEQGYSPFFSMRRLVRLALPIACMSMLLATSPAYATDTLDVATALKTWPFMNNRPSGLIVVAILFDPANPESKTDAESIKSDIEKRTGGAKYINMTAKLVSISDVSALAGASVAFLAKDISPEKFDTINNVAIANHILTVSADLTCVRANKCILGVVSKPRVEIYYSPQAAKAAGISFGSTFNMLVKQI